MSSKNVAEAYAPLRITNQLLGLRVFEYPRGRRRPLLSLIYLVLLFIPTLAATSFKMLNITNMSSPLENLIHKFHSYINVVTIAYNTFIGWYQSKPLEEFLRRMKNVDSTLFQFGVPMRRYRTTFNMTVFAETAIIIQQLGQMYIYMFLMTHFMSFAYGFIITCPFIHGDLIRSITVADYVLNTSFLENGYRHVNIILQDTLSVSERVDKIPSVLITNVSQLMRGFPTIKTIRQQSPDDDVNNRYRKINRTLQTMRQVHLELTLMAKSLSSVFSAQMLLELGIIITAMVSAFYSVYTRLTRYDLETDVVRIVEMTAVMFMCLNLIIKIFFINHICEKIYNEGNKSKEILCSFNDTKISSETRTEINQFLLQMINCGCSCSPGGFFMLGHSFIVGFLGTVSTYLVILIQMSGTLNEKIGDVTSVGEVTIPDIYVPVISSPDDDDYIYAANNFTNQSTIMP